MKNNIFAAHARCKLSVDFDSHVFASFGNKCLCRKYVFNLGGTDTERQSPKRAMRCRMRIAYREPVLALRSGIESAVFFMKVCESEVVLDKR